MIEPHECEACGREYKPRTRNQKFCGVDCRSAAARRRAGSLPEAEWLLLIAGLGPHARTFEVACAADQERDRREQYRIDHARTTLAEAGADGYRFTEDGREILIPARARPDDAEGVGAG